MRSLSTQLFVSALLLLAEFIGVRSVIAIDDLDLARRDAGNRIIELKKAEDKLHSEIDSYDRQIAEYQKAIEVRRLALQQVNNEIKSLQLSFKWF